MGRYHYIYTCAHLHGCIKRLTLLKGKGMSVKNHNSIHSDSAAPYTYVLNMGNRTPFHWTFFILFYYLSIEGHGNETC